MKREAWNWICLIGALIMLCLLAPRIAFAGAVGLIAGNWHRWNAHMDRIWRS